MSKADHVRQKLFEATTHKFTPLSNTYKINQDSQLSIQMESYDNLQTKCRKLVQINQNMQYNMGILETQLDVLKKMQQQKIKENKKSKQMVKLKLQKQQQLKRHLKLQREKIKKLLMGLKNLGSQAIQMQKKEQQTRQRRLKAQQTKNQIYEKYNRVQQQYKQRLIAIKQFDGIHQMLIQMDQRNADINQKIAQVQNNLKSEIESTQNKQKMKKQRNIKVKQLNEQVLQLEREQNNLVKQIRSVEKNQLIWQSEKQQIQQKSAQAITLYKKIQQAKTDLADKKTELAQIDSTYKQLCIQENRIKKEIILAKQCKQEQKKYKQLLKNRVKQPIQNIENLEVNAIDVPKVRQMEDSSFSKLQGIMKRFENIKNKNN